MSELLPCPFCGGKAVYRSDVKGKFNSVGCDDCICGTIYYSNKQKVIDAWNKRHEPKEDKKKVTMYQPVTAGGTVLQQLFKQTRDDYPKWIKHEVELIEPED